MCEDYDEKKNEWIAFWNIRVEITQKSENVGVGIGKVNGFQNLWSFMAWLG